MKSLIASIALIASVNSFAVSNCTDIVSGEVYPGTITAESNELSYNNCPKDVLVNDRFVAELILVKDSEGNPTCGYSFAMVTFLCDN